MDIKEFIQFHIDNETYNNIAEGFVKSEYVVHNNEYALFIKQILNKLSNENKYYNLLQSGGLSTHDTTENKKISFCTEFNIFISNIIGLIGFDISKYLLILFGSRVIINNLIQNILSCESYNDIKTNINLLSNFMNLNNYSVFHLNKEFINKIKNNKDKDSIEYYNYEIDDSSCKLLFDYLLSHLNMRLTCENTIIFNSDKQYYYNTLTDMMNNLIINEYDINCVDELIINLGKYNICYDNSFIKMFEILHNESYADIPYELWEKYNPTIQYLTNDLDIDVNNICNILDKYYRKIFNDTYEVVFNDIGNKIANIKLTNKMYISLVNITISLLVNISIHLSNNQFINMYFGKSTRIQFVQLYDTIINCTPRNMQFSKSQRTILHYILLSDKIIKDSYDLISK